MKYKLKINIKECKTLEDVSEFIKLNKIRLILFAETHGILEELKIQDRIITILKPTSYLYELLEEEEITSENDFIEFLKKKDSERFSIISSFGELKPTIQLAKKYHLPVIGCDIKNMLRKNNDFLKETNIKKEEKIMIKREEKQSEVIKESLKQYGSPIFVSLGAFHLRRNSPLFKNIKMNSIIIRLLINKKELNNLGKNFNIKNAKEITYLIEFNKNET